MKLALAADHAGFSLKDSLVKYLREAGHDILDLGVESAETRTDYPDAAEWIAKAILDGRAERGILICGSGIGASIAANKIPGIYAAICHDTYSAHQGVEHDNMNVMCIGGRIVGPSLAEELADAYINAEFINADRYLRRFQMVQSIEARTDTPR